MLRRGSATSAPKPKRRRTQVSGSQPQLPLPPSTSSPGQSGAPQLSTSATGPSASPPPNAAKWFRNPSVVWFRGHDLRIEDHPALLAAAQRGGPVAPLFIWDEEDNFGNGLGEMKRWWLKHSLLELAKALKKLGVPLYLRVGRSTVELRKFLKATGADAVFWNRCYEPDLLQRDEEMRVELGLDGMTAESFKAELLVEPWELSNSSANPVFNTFHLYMRAWMAFPPPPQPFPCPSRLQSISAEVAVGEISDLGLQYPQAVADSLSKLWTPGSAQANLQLEKFVQEVFPVFGEARCRRHFKGTSRLSPHVRFGELSPRRMYHATKVRVSRWDPSREHAAPLAAVLGMTAGCKPGLAHTSDCLQNSTAVEDSNQEASDHSESSTRSSLTRNHMVTGSAFESGPALGTARENGMSSKKVARKPRSVKATNEDKKIEVQRHKGCTLVGTPHISLSAKAFLKNLCLRDFGYHVLFHHPTFDTKSLVPEFDCFPWAPDEGSFDAWRLGNTGYPLVDAAMRELRSTGWVHNSMRFLLACFLTKYLLLPWQRGLKEFYGLLLDGDHSSNALGWQWTSGSNTDSFPFSCLVNPVKFGTILDPNGDYVLRWVPELTSLPKEFVHEPWNAPESVRAAAGFKLGESYPVRIVHIGEARRRAKDAMLKMKTIFTQMRPSRMLSDLSLDALVRDWPQDSICSDEDDPQGGRLGLLPSLWSLLQSSDSSSTHFGAKPVTAHEAEKNVASVAARVASDNHNSIEHALLTAHSTSGRSDMFRNVDSSNARRGASGTRKKALRPKKPVAVPNAAENIGLTPEVSRDDVQNIETIAKKENNSNCPVAPQQRAGLSSRLLEYGGLPPYPPMGRHATTNPHYHQLVVQAQLSQVHQPGSQHQMPNNGMVFEGMYSAGLTTAPGPGLSVSNFPVLMGLGPGGVDSGMPNAINPVDFSNPAFYAHQMNMSHMYGLPSMMPMMPSPMGGRPDGDQSANGIPVTAVGAAGTARHVGVPPSFAMHYGMYGGNPGFDSNGFANVNEANQYAALHVASHQNQSSAQSCITPHHVYMPQPGNSDGIHGASGLFPGTGHLTSIAHNISPNGHCVSNQETAPSGPNGLIVTGTEKNATVVAALHENNARKAVPVASAPTKRRDSGSAPSRNGSVTSRKPKASIRKSGASNKGRSRGAGKAASPGGSGGRVAAKFRPAKEPSPTQGRVGSRGRRGAGGRAGRSRADARGTRAVAGHGGGSALKRKADGQSSAEALKTRQGVLDSVGEKEDHEYFHFARFLTGTYELTGNTDRHTSKDYIRLCTLKDNYHKQCQSDKEKLKIYRIKAFFSKILELEVTGEWDRHNHGGVRGPYVYGIRLKPMNLTDGGTVPTGDAARKTKQVSTA